MKAAACVVGALALLAACTPVGPRTSPAPPTEAGFSHADFDAFLSRHVDAEGRVDYERAASDRADLDRYLARLAALSPDSHPERLRTESDRLAYWLNAYNASVISLVLAHHPISSVNDVQPPFPLRFLPEGAGFFVFRRVVLGGKRLTLYGLEHRVIRPRFLEPRVHFALNCASRGCPRLPARAFSPAGLEAELEREARRFVAEERNVRVDAEARRLYLSSLFDWFEEDFTRWLAKRRPELERSLRGYVLLYASGEKESALRDCTDCELAFVPYDWSLNGQAHAAAPRSERSARCG